MSILAWLAACDGTEEEGPCDAPEQPAEAPTEAPPEETVVDTGAPPVDTGTDTLSAEAFDALVYYPDGFGYDPRVATFDENGCVVSFSAVRIDEGIEQLVVADGRWFAITSGGLGEVDTTTGAFTLVPYPPSWYVSWEMSVAVDPATGEVLVGTLGGEGELIAYDVDLGQFDRRGSFDNDDIVALAALTDGRVIALEHPRSSDAVTTLLRYDADLYPLGEATLSIPLSAPNGGSYASESWQLRESGDTLYALVRTDDLAELVRTYVVDPGTGTVTPVECP